MKHVTVTATSPDQACERAARVFHAHRLVPRAGSSFGFTLRSISVGPITIGELRYGNAVGIQTGEYGSFYQVNQAVQGTLRTSSGRERLEISPRWAAVYRPDRPTAIAGWERPATMIGVKIERKALERAAESFGGTPLDGSPLPLMMGLDTSHGVGLEWRAAVRRLLAAADAGIADAPLLQSVLVEDCLQTLLAASAPGFGAEGGPNTPDGANGPNAAGRTAFDLAVELIHAASPEPLTLSVLAAHAGVSGRALQLAFQLRLGVTPMHYLRQVRLDDAHRLLGAGTAISVRQAAEAAGFAHLGRFAAEYTARYGETPSDTLRRRSEKRTALHPAAPPFLL